MTSRKIAVYIATTAGPVRIDRLVLEPAPQSVVCLNRSSEVLPISADYDDFVRPGSGVIMREFGPFGGNAFRMDLAGGSISGGKSWQLPVFIAHAVDTAADCELVPEGEDADEIIWATGLVDYDLNVGAVNHIPEKLAASTEQFKEWDKSEKFVRIFMADGNNAMQARETGLPERTLFRPAMSAASILAELGIVPTASSSEASMMAKTGIAEPRFKSDGKGWKFWLGAGLVAIAILFGVYKNLQETDGDVEETTTVEQTTLPPPGTKQTGPETRESRLDKKLESIAIDLLADISRNRQSLKDRGDGFVYGNPSRVIVWPFRAGDAPVKLAGLRKINDSFMASLLRAGGEEYSFVARDSLKAIIKDLEETGGLNDDRGDTVGALLAKARDVDILIKGEVVPDGDGAQVSFKALRMDGVILAQTTPRYFKIKRTKKADGAGPVSPGDLGVPLALHLTTERGNRPTYKIGERLNLNLSLSRDAWLYCFYHDAAGDVTQIFPNPELQKTGRTAKLSGGRAYSLPGAATFPFDLVISPPTGNETIQCYASSQDIGANLPSSLQGQSLDPITEFTVEEIDRIFKGQGQIVTAETTLTIID